MQQEKKYALAIDTSTDISGLAICHDGDVLTEFTWRSDGNHTVELVPRIDYLLGKIKATPHQLAAVFVAKGPGSFNGLRVGVSVAKGLAFALNIPVVGVSTLEVEAYAFAYTDLPICAIHSAGRGELAVAFYQRIESWQCLKAEHLITPEALCEQIVTRTLFCGEIPTGVSQLLTEKLGERALIADPVARLRRAGYLAALGWQRLKEGKIDDPIELQPIYMRPPPITQRKVR